jgi:hypothetical protein
MHTKIFFPTLLVFATIVVHAGNVEGAGDKAAVERELTTLQQQMGEMQQQMEELEAQLEASKQSAAAAQAQAQQATQVVDQKMAEVSGKFKTLDDLAQKFKNLKLSGKMRLRWWEGDHEQNSFDVSEVQFNLRYDVSENISGEFHVQWHPSGNMSGRSEYDSYSNWLGSTTRIESAFAEFRNLNLGPVEGTLLVGKGWNQAFGIIAEQRADGRVTSDMDLFHYSNNSCRITGVQYLTKWKDLRWNFAVFNGYALSGDSARFGARPAGIRLLRGSETDLDGTSGKAYSTRLFWAPSIAGMRGLTLGWSYFHQKLSDNDLKNFNAIMGRNAGMQGNFWGDPTRTRSDWKTGFDVAYDYGPFAFKAESLWGSTAGVAVNTWYAMAGYKLKHYRVDFWLRYGQATYDQRTIPDISASGAWDKDQWTPCIIYHLHPMADVYFEYYVNGEDNPGNAHKLTNNYGFIELLLKF